MISSSTEKLSSTTREEDEAETISPLPHTAESIVERLNDYERRDREGRRADSRSLEKQDSLGLTNQLLLKNAPLPVGTVALTLVHSGENRVHGVDTTNLEKLKNQPILMYGFDKPRREMMEKLLDHLGFQKLQTMNQYNIQLGIGFSFGFDRYRRFLKEPTIGLKTPNKGTKNITLEELHGWRAFLSDHRQEFDFSGRLNSLKERERFLIKNYDPKRIDFGVDDNNSDLKKALEAANWEAATEMLKEAFDLLNSMGTSSSKNVDKLYAQLSPDQKNLLDQMIAYAFLRKTSKLGMEFAQSQNIPVFFTWQVPGEDADNLERIRGLLEVKPYKFSPMKERINPEGKITPEPITLSEMRHLERLRQKMLQPSYLLISKLEVVEKSKGTASSAPSTSLSAQLSKPLFKKR